LKSDDRALTKGKSRADHNADSKPRIGYLLKLSALQRSVVVFCRTLMTVKMAPATVVPPADPPGPHPSYIQVAKPFIFEQKVQGQIIATGANPAREDNFRLQGVQWIDEVRRALQLSV
jgi:hypothetical protein